MTRMVILLTIKRMRSTLRPIPLTLNTEKTEESLSGLYRLLARITPEIRERINESREEWNKQREYEMFRKEREHESMMQEIKDMLEPFNK